MWKKAAEMTNVSLKTVSSKNVSDKQQAFNTMLASGNIPDIVVYDDAKTYLSQYGQEGAFEPIDELIKEEKINQVIAVGPMPMMKAMRPLHRHT